MLILLSDISRANQCTRGSIHGMVPQRTHRGEIVVYLHFVRVKDRYQAEFLLCQGCFELFYCDFRTVVEHTVAHVEKSLASVALVVPFNHRR